MVRPCIKFVAFLIALALLPIDAGSDEPEVYVLKPVERYKSGDVMRKAPDTTGADIVVDAPWRVLRKGRSAPYIPVLIYVPDTDLDNSSWYTIMGRRTPVGMRIESITIHQGDQQVFRDVPGEPPSAGASFTVVDETGREVSSDIAGSPGGCKGSERPCDIPHPGGWHRIIRIPISQLQSRQFIYLKTEMVLSAVYEQETPDALKTLFSNTLRIQLSDLPLPSLGEEWHYFDAHMHSIAEWTLDEGLLAPRKAFGGPIQMVKESAYAIGLTASVDQKDFVDHVIATDHNAFFSDEAVVAVGPTAIDPDVCEDFDGKERKRCIGEAEFAMLRGAFGTTFGEEVALHTNTIDHGLNFGSHLLLMRADHVHGPWHGGLLAWRIPGTSIRLGGEWNENTLAAVLANASKQKSSPFAYAAHPFGSGNFWNVGQEEKNSLQRLSCRSDEFVTPSDEFVFKGAQYWNGKAAWKIAASEDVDFSNFHPFREAPSTSRTGYGEGKKFPSSPRSSYLKLEPNPEWDSVLTKGLIDYHTRVSCLLEFSFCETDPVPQKKRADGIVEECECKPIDQSVPRQTFPRKIYMVAGTDAHGDFNYETSLLATMLDHELVLKGSLSQRNMTTNAFGLVRTYVNTEGKTGLPAERRLDALADGNSVLTDGPVIQLELDADRSFETESASFGGPGVFDADGRVGGNGSMDGGFTALISKGQGRAVLRIRWANNEDFGDMFAEGAPDSVALYVDRPLPEDDASCNAGPPKGDALEPAWPKKPILLDQNPLEIPLADVVASLDSPIAISAAVFANKPERNEDFRGYTNPIWLIPVGVSAEFAHDRERLKAGEVRVSASFGMSMQATPLSGWIQRLGTDGRPTGPRSPLAAGTWSPVAKANGPPIANAQYVATNAEAFELSAGSSYVIVLEHPVDAYANPLNSVASKFKR